MAKELKLARSYQYFDTPDGQDVFHKLLVVLKPTTIAALGFSTIDVMLYSHPKGYLPILGRFAYVSAPILGMATAFVVATNMSASIREQDDKLNWILGGFAAGSIVGLWRQNPRLGFVSCAAFGLLAGIKKHAIEHDWTLFPEGKLNTGEVLDPMRDFSFTAERPRNWTTENESQ